MILRELTLKEVKVFEWCIKNPILEEVEVKFIDNETIFKTPNGGRLTLRPWEMTSDKPYLIAFRDELNEYKDLIVKRRNLALHYLQNINFLKTHDLKLANMEIVTKELYQTILITPNGGVLAMYEGHINALDSEKGMGYMKHLGLHINSKYNGKHDACDAKISHFNIPEWVKDVDDLAEYLQLKGDSFSVLKSLFSVAICEMSNIDRHDGISVECSSDTICHYASRLQKRIHAKK